MLKLTKVALDAMFDALKAVVPFAVSDTTPEEVVLFTNDVDPDASTLLADLDLATFTGSAPKPLVMDTPGILYTDPLSGERIIETPQLSSGLTFVCTATPGAPETIYGYAVTNAAGTVLLGAERLPEAITINEAGQGIDIPTIETRFNSTLHLV